MGLIGCLLAPSIERSIGACCLMDHAELLAANHSAEPGRAAVQGVRRLPGGCGAAQRPAAPVDTGRVGPVWSGVRADRMGQLIQNSTCHRPMLGVQGGPALPQLQIPPRLSTNGGSVTIARAGSLGRQESLVLGSDRRLQRRPPVRARPA